MYDCCKVLTDRVEVGRQRTTGGPVVIQRCKTCGRRHFEVSLDPGKFGVKFPGPPVLNGFPGVTTGPGGAGGTFPSGEAK